MPTVVGGCLPNLAVRSSKSLWGSCWNIQGGHASNRCFFLLGRSHAAGAVQELFLIRRAEPSRVCGEARICVLNFVHIFGVQMRDIVVSAGASGCLKNCCSKTYKQNRESEQSRLLLWSVVFGAKGFQIDQNKVESKTQSWVPRKIHIFIFPKFTRGG